MKKYCGICRNKISGSGGLTPSSCFCEVKAKNVDYFSGKRCSDFEIKIPKEQQGFYRGVAMVVAFLIRDHGEESLGIEALKVCTATIEDLEAAQVDEFDLKVIKRVLKV